MLDRRWLALLIVLDVFAWRTGQGLLGLAATYGLLLAAMMRLLRAVALRGVRYRRVLMHDRASCGDELELVLTLENDKLWPLAYLEVEDQLPRHVSVLGAQVRLARESLLPSLFIRRAMLPYERVTRSVRVRCDRRGVQSFGPAQCRSGDFLSEPTEHRNLSEQVDLLVLPKTVPLFIREDAASPILGPLRARHALSPDPLRVVGARDYRSGDPLRSVDWRATARRGALLVRQLEPSAMLSLQLILDFEVRSPRTDRVEPDELELAISVVASLAAHAARHGWAFGLRGNGFCGGAALEVGVAAAPEQLGRVLEALARARSRASATLGSWLEQQPMRELAHGAIGIVTCQLDAALAANLRRLQRRGTHVFVVVVGGEVASECAGLSVRQVPYEEGWQTREALVLA